MSPTTIRLVLAFALPAAAFARPPAADAQQPTQVAVHVQLTDRLFRIRFGPATPQVEQRLAEIVAAQLGRRIGFVRFAPLGTGPHRLTFALDRNDRVSGATGQQVDRGFWVKLTQPGQDSTTIYWFTLRPAHATSEPIPSLDALVAEVQNKLELQDYKPLEQLLSRVPVATEAMISDAPLGWALPFKRDVLCMNNETGLRVEQIEVENQIQLVRPYSAKIRAVFNRDPGPDKHRFRDGLLGEPDDAALRTALQQAIRRRLVQGVKAVYVVDYQHAGNCGLEALRPNTGSPAGGGGA